MEASSRRPPLVSGGTPGLQLLEGNLGEACLHSQGVLIGEVVVVSLGLGGLCLGLISTPPPKVGSIVEAGMFLEGIVADNIVFHCKYLLNFSGFALARQCRTCTCRPPRRRGVKTPRPPRNTPQES